MIAADRSAGRGLRAVLNLELLHQGLLTTCWQQLLEALQSCSALSFWIHVFPSGLVIALGLAVAALLLFVLMGLLVCCDEERVVPAAEALHGRRRAQRRLHAVRPHLGHHLIKSRPLLNLQVQPLPEEVAGGPHIPIKRLGRIGVVQVHNLWKVNECDFLFSAYHEVELIEIAVHNACARQPHQEPHEPLQDLLRVLELPDAGERHPVDEAHDDRVPVLVDRQRHGEALVPQRLHVRELLQRSQPCHVHP
mmetsp:Transcript_978/g.2968  ORF Transcript_978/g.2968 Transcript_978/m.2968 type:complete len:250 (-) Transcript_978:538-1287(-)